MDMTETSAQPQPAMPPRPVRIFFGVFGTAAILVSGCAARKKPAIPWSTAVLVRPKVPQLSSAPGDLEDPVPELKLEIPPPPPPLATRTVPPRPRRIAPATNQNAAPEKTDNPQIVPELTTQESSALQREANQSLATAERNLAATTGKSLSATQSDLASKVRSFIADAREAGRAGDWERARDLAKKAQVLSEELAGSL
jgi:type IV secretory pathway VirB10-like protein